MKRLNLILEGVIIAARSLKGHVLRTFLTVLGVSIGIFAITLIFTLVNSLQYSIGENLSKLGNTVFFVHNWPWAGASDDWYKFTGRPKVSFDDFTRVREGVSAEHDVVFEVTLGQQVVKYNSRTVSGVEVKGATQEYADINSLDFSVGRFFSLMEADGGRPVCVIGYNVARAIMGNGPYIDQYIRLSGKKVKVVGVIEELGAPFFGVSMDDRVIVPYTFVARHFNVRKRSYDKLITVRAADYEALDELEGEVIGLMRAERGLRPKTENDFSINKQEMLMDSLDKVFGALRTGGMIISFFSILVGGFGIGNIMYTSVKERTFEIGLQKSLGAKRWFILIQFLFESVFLCIIGGLVGLLLLFLTTLIGDQIVERMNISLDLVISLGTILYGMGISVVIGLASGLIPSIYASGLDPVESMRAK